MRDLSDVDIFNGCQYVCGVVGESFYQEALFYCWHDPATFTKLKAKYIKVRLKLEDDNPYDQWAVGVISEYGKIGHLPRRLAILYRQEYKGRDNLSINAKITSKDPSSLLFGVWLDLPYNGDEEIFDKPIYSCGGVIEWQKQPSFYDS